MVVRALRKFLQVSPIVVAFVIAATLSGASRGEGIGIAPQVEVASDGKVTVKWETRHDCAGPGVSFGMDVEADPFGLPLYRFRVSAKSDSRSHTAVVSLKDIEKVARGATFNGKVFYRATCFDLKSKTWLDTGDCVFRYVKRGGSYRKGVAIIEGPIVANLTSHSAHIRWVTDVPCVGRVLVGKTSKPALPPQSEHEILVDGLQPSTRYSYRVETWTAGDDGFRTRSYEFRTAPWAGSEESFVFAVFSDTRAHDYTPVAVRAVNGINAQVLRQIAVAAFWKEARFAVVPGDLISGVTSDAHRAELELRSWKKAVAPVAPYTPFYTGIGNHDAEIYDRHTIDGKSLRLGKEGTHSAEEIFRREMTNPTNGPELPQGSKQPTYRENVYSFDHGNSHFTMLNNDYKPFAAVPAEKERGKIVGPQLEWLRRDLESATNRGQENIFVFFHEPAFPTGGHVADSMYHDGDDAYVKPRNAFWRLLCQHKVVAVFCGHEHNYSRTLVDQKVHESFSQPIWQIVTGGGGAPFHPQDKPPWRKSVKAFSLRQNYCIVSVAGQKVRLRVFDPAGNLIDRADLK